MANKLGSHSQANDDTERKSNPVVNIFRQIADNDRAREEARLNKRLKRNATANGIETPSAVSTPGPATPTLEPEKKVTKKDMKVAEAKFTEAQQHKHANETARMATSNLLGGSNLFGKKKVYSWMTPGGSGPGAKPSPVPTVTSAAKITSALSDNAPAPVVKAEKPAVVVPKGKQLGEWDDSAEPGAIQARDLLTILESDDRAWKAVQLGYNKPEV